MTKEEINAQIELIEGLGLCNYFTTAQPLIDKLNQELKNAKSIEDLQKEAFDSSRELADGWSSKINSTPKYETFKDYINTKKRWR